MKLLYVPTYDEKSALAGTDGTPSAVNPYVTDSDSRNSDTRTPTDGTVTEAKLAAAATQTISANDFAITHNDKDALFLTVGAGPYVQTTAGAVAGARDGQTLLIVRTSGNGYLTVKSGGNMTLFGNWYTYHVGAWLRLCWDANAAVWREVARAFTGSYSGTMAGIQAFTHGGINIGSGSYCHAEGDGTQATGSQSHSDGKYSVAGKSGEQAHACGRFAASGDCQNTKFQIRVATTNDTPTEMHIAFDPGRFTLVNSKAYACTITLLARLASGAGHLMAKQMVLIERTAAGTVQLVGTPQTIGTDIDTTGGATFAITADDTNKSLMVTVTGIAATNIRWTALIEAVEILYA